MRDVFAIQFGFDAGFAEDVDGFFVCGEFQDARDVDCGAVGGAEDFILGVVIWLGCRGEERGRERRGEGRGGGTYDCGGYAHVCEFLLVVGPGFGAVVRYEDDLFAFVDTQHKAFERSVPIKERR